MTATLKFVIGALSALLVIIAWLIYYASSTVVLSHYPYEFTLRQGSSLTSVAKQLVAQDVISEQYSFIALGRLFGHATNLKAGSYVLDKPLTHIELLKTITEGNVSQGSITFVEGWTFAQMRQALDAYAAIKHDTRGLSDQEILKRVSGKPQHPEGLFFPDTYFFSQGMSDLVILKRAYKNMQARVNEAWQARASALPYKTPYEALIMASIVEKESAKASERPIIAAVFLNRLRQGMKLQTDPTVIYGLGASFDGNLRKRDLLSDAPYNTYTREGLPPTPIAMPGWGAIHASLHPAKTDALYFVSKGDGSHVFSATLEEHNRAVAKYQKIARQ